MIRKMTPSDINSVYRLICILEDTSLDYLQIQSIFPEILKTHDVFVYEEKNQILGYADLRIESQLHHSGKVAEIVELCVDPDVRNQQIGTQLFEYIKEFAQEKDCVLLELDCNNKRLQTHKFYENLGMKHTHCKYTINL